MHPGKIRKAIQGGEEFSKLLMIIEKSLLPLLPRKFS
jgi:hypothetical protein